MAGVEIGLVGTEADEEARCERLDGENARLREQIEEVQGWYRLLQADHAALQNRHRQVGRKTTEIQAERDRLEGENRELQALASHREGPGGDTKESRKGLLMTGLVRFLRGLRRNRWAAAAIVASQLATLVGPPSARPQTRSASTA